VIEPAHTATAFNFRFEGRVPRLAYLIGAAAAHALSTVDIPELGALANPVAVACFWVGKFLLSTVAVKRLHDIGASGWWAVPIVAPMALWGGGIGTLALLAPELTAHWAGQINWGALILTSLAFGAVTLVLGLIPGQAKDNEYGSDPKGLVGRSRPGLHPPY
jgi:uncharacterized membrane protein YhaH (DUF805 family)